MATKSELNREMRQLTAVTGGVRRYPTLRIAMGSHDAPFAGQRHMAWHILPKEYSPPEYLRSICLTDMTGEDGDEVRRQLALLLADNPDMADSIIGVVVGDFGCNPVCAITKDDAEYKIYYDGTRFEFGDYDADV